LKFAFGLQLLRYIYQHVTVPIFSTNLHRKRLLYICMFLQLWDFHNGGRKSDV